MIILEDINFDWKYDDMLKAAEMWKKETPVADMAKEFNRDADEVFLLLLHLARQHRVKIRCKNLYGK